MSLNKDGITTAFELISEEIEIFASELNKKGEKAFQENKYQEAKQLADSGKKLENFREKVEGLLDEWQNVYDLVARESMELKGIERPSKKTRNKRKQLRVTLKDGTIFENKLAADTFVEVIRNIGLLKIEKLGIKVRGFPLIGSQESKKYQQKIIDGKYVITHSSTEEKRKILQKVSRMLNINMQVEIE